MMMLDDELEMRCPHCNGTGKLLVAAAERIQSNADDVAILKNAHFELWWDFQEAMRRASTPKATIERVRAELKALHDRHKNRVRWAR